RPLKQRRLALELRSFFPALRRDPASLRFLETWLASNFIHRAGRPDKVSRVDAVAWLFGADAVAEQLGEVLVGAAAAEEGAGVPFDDGEQAVANFAFGGEAEAVAIFAERLRDRIDEADGAAAVGKAKVGRRLAGIGALGGLEWADRLFDLAA